MFCFSGSAFEVKFRSGTVLIKEIVPVAATPSKLVQSTSGSASPSKPAQNVASPPVNASSNVTEGKALKALQSDILANKKLRIACF